ncbi:MAG: 2-C-methyl-D-erythritol 4-phosphate cytidylyltransferase [Deltaproteobacteria bacterium]
MSRPRVSAIVVAAGSGSRMPGAVRKQFLPLGGKPVIAHTLEAFERCDLIAEIALVLPEDSISYAEREISAKFGFRKVSRIIPGGALRQESVYRGFQALASDAEILLVHDGVRPFVSQRVIWAVVDEARRSGAAIAAAPVKDTIKKASPDGTVAQTVPREALWLAQTPQAFRRGILARALWEAESSDFRGTDEASIVERLGIAVSLVLGSPLNIKITTHEDLALGEAILNSALLASDDF